MFGKNFQRKYALTDQGVKNAKKGAFWTVIVNLVVMDGMGILYLLMYGLMGTLTDGAPLPGPALFLGLVIAFVILSFVTHLQQYHATYGLVYNEVKSTRLSLAERLRKLPLGYFGKRDLADLTETLMGDVNRMEHVWSHVLGYLYGAYISTAIIAVCLLVYDWRLTIACLWNVEEAREGGSMPELLRQLAKHQATGGLDARIRSLLDTRWEEDGYLSAKLCRLARMLRSDNRQVMPDADSLLTDVLYWNNDRRTVQLRWAQRYFQTSEEE